MFYFCFVPSLIPQLVIFLEIFRFVIISCVVNVDTNLFEGWVVSKLSQFWKLIWSYARLLHCQHVINVHLDLRIPYKCFRRCVIGIVEVWLPHQNFHHAALDLCSRLGPLFHVPVVHDDMFECNLSINKRWFCCVLWLRWRELWRIISRKRNKDGCFKTNIPLLIFFIIDPSTN